VYDTCNRGSNDDAVLQASGNASLKTNDAPLVLQPILLASYIGKKKKMMMMMVYTIPAVLAQRQPE
jgi:hypothetical protein